MFCNALCFPLVATSQVMTRLNLNWIGDPGDPTITFKIAFVCAVIMVVLRITSVFITYDYSFAFSNPWFYVISGPIQSIIFIYFLVVAIRTRAYIRRKYRIPSQCCGGIEDFCCVFFCSCCTVSQMGRHTTDYDTHSGYCCSRTGLQSNIKKIENGSTIAQSDRDSLV